MGFHNLRAILMILMLITPISSHQEQTDLENSSCVGGQGKTCSSAVNNVWARFTDTSDNSSASWRFKYIDEQKPEFLSLVQDDTLDSRLSNLVHTVNSVRASNVDMHLYNWANPEATRELKRLAADSRVDHQLCGAQLAQMLHLLADMAAIVRNRRLPSHAPQPLTEKHNRLARLLDSFGRPGAGLHTGRSVFLGSHLQCQDSRLLLSGEDGNVSRPAGRYCVAKLDLSRHLHPTLRARPPHPHEQRLQLAVGVCLPETCHSASFHAHGQLIKRLLESQFELPETMYVDRHLELADLYCPPTGDSPLASTPMNGRILLGLLLSWFMLTIYATMRGNNKESATQDTKTVRVLDALDLKSSLDDFCMREVPEQTGRIDLDVINPIKVIACLFAVSGHALMMVDMISPSLARNYRDWDYDPLLMMAVGTNITVDTFYVISGILATYFITRRYKFRLEKKHHSVREYLRAWVEIVSARFARLVPLYFIVYWFKRSVLIYLGSGPLWDHGLNTDTMQGGCKQESWLLAFGFKPPYLPMSRQCLPATWTVSGDLFFFLFLTPVILLSIKRIRLAVVISILLIIASNIQMLKEIRSIDPTLFQILKEGKLIGFNQLFNTASYIHTAMHLRVASFLIGALAGYALYQFNEGKGLREWPGWFRGPITWISSLIVPFLLFVGPTINPLFRDQIENSQTSTADLFTPSITAGRLIWSISNAVLLLRMVTDWKDSYLARVSATRFWRNMAKLNYAILLIHVDLIIINVQLGHQIPLASKVHALSLTAAGYMVSCVIGFLLHVLIENPMDKLIKCYLQ